MDAETKDRIDGMSYGTMLDLWRFSASGHPLFQGETGEYFAKVMAEKRDALPLGEASNTSKRVGWR